MMPDDLDIYYPPTKIDADLSDETWGTVYIQNRVDIP